jgi:hypothetical protein
VAGSISKSLDKRRKLAVDQWRSLNDRFLRLTSRSLETGVCLLMAVSCPSSLYQDQRQLIWRRLQQHQNQWSFADIATPPIFMALRYF